MNLKKLFIGAFVAASAMFAASCTQEEGEIVPVDITVSEPSLQIDSLGGSKTVTLKSNRPWTVEKVVENPWGNENADWLTVDPLEGGATEGQEIKLTAALNATDSVNYERTVHVYFRTDKEIFATVTVYQEGIVKPNAWEHIYIKDLLKLAQKEGEKDVVITKPFYIEGAVVNFSDPQTATYKNIYVQDDTEPNSGLLIRDNDGAAYKANNFGSILRVKLMGGHFSYYNGDLQFNAASLSDIEKTGDCDPDAAKISGEELLSGKYVNQYVKVVAQVVTADLEKAMQDFPDVETEDGSVFTMYTAKSSTYTTIPWDKTKVPQGSGDLYGLCTKRTDKEGNVTYRIIPQREADFAGMTGERFSGAPAVTTGEWKQAGTKFTLSGSYKSDKKIDEVGIGLKKQDEKEYVYTAAAAVAENFEVVYENLESVAYDYVAYVKIGDQRYEGETRSFSAATETTITIAELIEKVKGMERGASMASVATYAEGIVTGTNEGGNLYKKLAVEDGTGKPNTGILFEDGALNKGFKVGDKVKIKLTDAFYAPDYDTRRIMWAANKDDQSQYKEGDITVLSQNETFTTPEVTVKDLAGNDYQGMYVKVKNLKLAGKEAVQFSSSASLPFTDGTDTLAVRTTSYAKWAKEYVNPAHQGVIAGVMQIFKKNPQMTPVNKADMEPFFGEAPAPKNPVIEGTAGKGVFESSIELSEKNTAITKTGSVYFNKVKKSAEAKEEYPCVKIGTGSNTGDIRFKLGKEGDVTFSMYAVSWKGDGSHLFVEVLNGGKILDSEKVELKTVDNAGLSGGENTYNITPGEKDFYELKIVGATANTEVKISTNGVKKKRAALWGIDIK